MNLDDPTDRAHAFALDATALLDEWYVAGVGGTLATHEIVDRLWELAILHGAVTSSAGEIIAITHEVRKAIAEEQKTR